MRGGRLWAGVVGIALSVMAAGGAPRGQARDAAWTRHTIDGSSRGADGARAADANGDGLPDLVTGWEQGRQVRLYLNPGPRQAKQPWPAVTLGRVGSPEDAVLADLDGDGAADVISSCEGRTRSLFVHWAPREKKKLLDPAAWKTEALPAAQGAKMWMFCLPLQVDGKRGLDLVAGAKEEDAEVGWFEAPPNPRNLAAWKWHPIAGAGWIMSLLAEDMDGDGDLDVVASDRKGERRGCWWFANPGPGPAQAQPWPRVAIGGQGCEVMFLVLRDLDGDGLRDVVTSRKPQEVLWLRRTSRDGRAWERVAIPFPSPERAGRAKGIEAGDLDLDGRPEIVFSCESATGERSGVMAMSYRRRPADIDWTARDISGPPGTKFDLIELLDLDGDGDQDVITCEEAENLGVIWYENPAR